MPRVKIGAKRRDAAFINVDIAHLRYLDIKALRSRWRISFGRDAPPQLARHLLFASLAYRLQTEVMGDLDAETVRFLEKIELAPSKKAAVPLTQAFEQRRRDLFPGTVLSRQWGGQHHRVMVLEGGFAWEGRTYSSLSEIAKSITGTKWNGPRFFGLRDNKPSQPAR